jgi:aromatic-L-amino-acid/L-tryptophan decarboxylase
MTNMVETGRAGREQTLDPADWDEFRLLAHQMVDDMVAHLSTLNDQPAWQQMPADTRHLLQEEPLPRAGAGAQQAYADFKQNVLPYPNGNLHPRFWGWVQGTGTPLAMLSEMLASGMNPHMAGFNQAPALVEHQVIEWLRQLMKMPEGTTGLLVSGGMMANILGLAVARHARAGFDVREYGLQERKQLLTVYASTETHGWLKKGCQFLGLGNRAIRWVPVNENFQMDTEKLQEMIAEDKKKGYKPIAVIATAGTINTGAVDDLEQIGSICRKHDLWFHIDGAFGAFAQISERFSHLVCGLESADSLGFDLHKWMYMPFEIACVLVKDGKAHREAFAMNASYIAETTRGVIAGGLPFAERGLELTRNFKALKVWMSLKAHGVDAFAGLIEQNIEQAKYLESLIKASPDLELLGPVSLNVVCFRFRADTEEASLNRLNEELLLRLQESGQAVLSGTTINNRYALRAAIVNHRSKFSDFDLLVSSVLELGRQLRSQPASH